MSPNLKSAILQHQSDAAMCHRTAIMWRMAYDFATDDALRVKALDKVKRWQHEARVSAESARDLMGMAFQARGSEGW